jgi:MATE family, multidrug efflux pump
MAQLRTPLSRPASPRVGRARVAAGRAHYLSAAARARGGLARQGWVALTQQIPAGPLATAAFARVARVAVPATQAVAGVVGIPTSASERGRANLQRHIWSMALPAIGEQMLAMGVGLTDTFLSGHLTAAAAQHLGYGRTQAVDAIGAASTAVWVVLTVFFAVNVGVTALVARGVGADDRALANRAAAQGIVLGALGGVVMLLMAVPLAEVITQALGLSGQVAALAAGYIRVLSLALPATGIASAANASMRGAGDTQRPMLVMLVVNGANIIGSLLLLSGVPWAGIPAIGVLGSAIGAATGWVLGAGFAIWLLRKQHPRAPRLAFGALRPETAMMGRVLRIGLPSAVEMIIFQIGVVTFLRSVVGLGSTAYAANVAINSVESIGTLPAFGFSVAATALVGQALGARDPELASRSAWETLRPCLAVVMTLGLLAVTIPQVLLGIFVADPSVMRAGAFAMRLSCLTMPASAIAMVFNGALRGAGDTKFPVIVRAAGTWGVRIPVAVLLIPLLALPGGRVVMALDFTTQAVLSCWRFQSGRWRRARV